MKMIIVLLLLGFTSCFVSGGGYNVDSDDDDGGLQLRMKPNTNSVAGGILETFYQPISHVGELKDGGRSKGRLPTTHLVSGGGYKLKGKDDDVKLCNKKITRDQGLLIGGMVYDVASKLVALLKCKPRGSTEHDCAKQNLMHNLCSLVDMVAKFKNCHKSFLVPELLYCWNFTKTERTNVEQALETCDPKFLADIHSSDDVIACAIMCAVNKVTSKDGVKLLTLLRLTGVNRAAVCKILHLFPCRSLVLPPCPAPKRIVLRTGIATISAACTPQKELQRASWQHREVQTDILGDTIEILLGTLGLT